MEHMCTRCARLALSTRARGQHGARSAVRSLSTTPSTRKDNKDAAGISAAGSSIDDALRSPSRPKSNTGRTASTAPNTPPPHPRSAKPSTPNQPGQVLRRRPQSGSPSPLNRGDVHRRAGPAKSPSSPQGTFLRRTGPGNKNGPSTAGPGGKSNAPRPGAPDRRRRREKPEGQEDEEDEAALSQSMDAYVRTHVDPPETPVNALPYNPSSLTVDSLRADWPNTPLSKTGLSESMVQKIEWLARRLPHGYTSPEDLAEHFLKGKLTRFESAEEKATVLKIAAEESAKTKLEIDEGSRKFWDHRRFQIRDDPGYTSISSREADKKFLVGESVSGEYAQVPKQQYAFMQNAARLLNNNETYGPAQSEKLLKRVQALIPQRGSAAPPQAAKTAKP